jgi:chromobox protein 1
MLIATQTGELKFEVKWEGYEKASDRTWEPEENL